MLNIKKVHKEKQKKAKISQNKIEGKTIKSKPFY